MFANSREITSAQSGSHPRLHEVVRRHFAAPYLRSPSAAGVAAFEGVVERLAAAPFVLDSGCGTGASTIALAREFPDRLVLGIDKSSVRLEARERVTAAEHMPQNALLLHCELVDFWQLAARAQLRCTKQYLLYPNPWPKPEHLKRRWHAHPVLPAILTLGGELELRTNWQIYADEFADSMRLSGLAAHVNSFDVMQALTPFERKYAASKHRLWCCRATRLSQTASTEQASGSRT